MAVLVAEALRYERLDRQTGQLAVAIAEETRRDGVGRHDHPVAADHDRRVRHGGQHQTDEL